MKRSTNNYSSLNDSGSQKMNIEDICLGRSRILSLYKSQKQKDHRERRRSFLKVFSKDNKDRDYYKNVLLVENFYNGLQAPRSMEKTKGIKQLTLNQAEIKEDFAYTLK